MNKKNIIIILAIIVIIIFGIILFMPNPTKKIDPDRNLIKIEECFYSGDEGEDYQFLKFEKRGFKILIPSYLFIENEIKETLTSFSMVNENYQFVITDESFSKNKYDYLLGNEVVDDFDNVLKSHFLYADEYYGNYSQKLTEDKVLIIKASIYKEKEDLFGYKYVIMDPTNKTHTSIEFLKRIDNIQTNPRSRYFYNFEEQTLMFDYGLSFEKYEEEITVKNVLERNELREKIQKEIILQETNKKDIQSKINNNEDITFEEYVAFLEYWGSYEDEAIEYAYLAGLKP